MNNLPQKYLIRKRIPDHFVSGMEHYAGITPPPQSSISLASATSEVPTNKSAPLPRYPLPR